MVVANHKWDGWQATLDQIFSVPLSDGWFDAYIDEEPEDDGGLADFAKSVNSLRKQMPVTVQLVNNQYNTSCQQFMGKMENPRFIAPQQDEAV